MSVRETVMQNLGVKRVKRALNVVQLVVLNAVATALVAAGFFGFGASLLTAVVWAWIGGAVVTLWLAIFIVGHLERRDRSRSPVSEEVIAAWTEDALDDAWETAVAAASEERARGHKHSAAG